MRGLLILICLVVVYYAVKTIIRSAIRGYQEQGARARLKGEEMVLDPQCRTYVIRERAVTRRVGGTTHYFCSEACARQYEEGHRG